MIVLFRKCTSYFYKSLHSHQSWNHFLIFRRKDHRQFLNIEIINEKKLCEIFAKLVSADIDLPLLSE